jgi:hypothetical protein
MSEQAQARRISPDQLKELLKGKYAGSLQVFYMFALICAAERVFACLVSSNRFQ